jgi:hypothetical protein
MWQGFCGEDAKSGYDDCAKHFGERLEAKAMEHPTWSLPQNSDEHLQLPLYDRLIISMNPRFS